MEDFEKVQTCAQSLEYSSQAIEEEALDRIQTLSGLLADLCEEPRLDELATKVDLPQSRGSVPAKEIKPDDLALVVWAQVEGTRDSGARKSQLEDSTFRMLYNCITLLETKQGRYSS